MHKLRFDNAFVRELPGDPEQDNRTRQVQGALYTRVAPTAVAAPRLLAYSREVAALLDIDAETVGTPWFAEIFGGNYGGHQFGHWAGQLGDGRASTLGEIINAAGQRWELQLKGAGPTPYSRRADGRAVLRSSVRAPLCSEVMHPLGVPTTRALSLVATGEAVMRDMFYAGNAKPEPGAIECRVAPSFIRFGNFDLDWTPNTSDAEGRRYRFGNQPVIVYWNLVRLATALAPLFADHDALHAGLQAYIDAFDAADRRNSAAKLGFGTCLDADIELIQSLYVLLQRAEVDMTLFFRALSDIDLAAPSLAPVAHAFYDDAKRRHAEADFIAWLTRYAARVHHDDLPPSTRRARMHAANPRYVLRNYLAQQVIDRAEQGDAAGIDELLEVLRRPYQDQPGRDQYAQRRPDWARNRAGCSMLSCSS